MQLPREAIIIRQFMGLALSVHYIIYLWPSKCLQLFFTTLRTEISKMTGMFLHVIRAEGFEC